MKLLEFLDRNYDFTPILGVVIVLCVGIISLTTYHIFEKTKTYSDVYHIVNSTACRRASEKCFAILDSHYYKIGVEDADLRVPRQGD